ncbi:putative Ig domain-containing protein [Kribbella sp. NPDC051952]|uniref:DUF7927 domain-containing protein n=1 Tax=Kribbella sp. NPDC051952 TaxID=3154851 RepID=UPI00342BE293
MGTTLAVVTANTANAAGTVLFENLFNNRTVDGTGTVTVPSPTSGTNVACLSAAGNSATLPLLSCAGSTDPQGSGKLRLTNSTTNQVGGVFGQTSFPTSNGLDVTFTSYQWGGGNADGIAFLLAAVDPANPASATRIGPSGGSLGYSPAGSIGGLPNAYLGVGLDVFGNFSATGFQGTGCTNAPNIVNQAAGAVVVRGPGNGLVGYCGLTTTSDGTLASKSILRAATRAASAVPVQVLINPTGAAFTSDSGVTVAAGTYKVVVTPVGQATKTLSGPLPSVAAGLYPSSSWLGANGVPKQLSFGFVGSTGSVTDVHEISAVKVLTFNPVPQLAVSTTSYTAPSSQPGDPVTYKIASSVLAGAAENSPISVSQTVPAGVVPVGAYGNGWTCAAAVGQSITCTTTAGSFAGGTVLPPITVVAIVTGSTVTSALVQSNSTVRASSADANPGTDTSATAGTVPTAPSGLAVVPAIGPIAGTNSLIVSGANITAATAIEIGTTAQQQAGTPVVLLPCSGAPAAGCFTVSGNNLVVSSMPARSAATTVSVTVVTSGVASAASYVYADKPVAPAKPTATAGISSATVAWVAPTANGSPITGYVVTPYAAGVAQSPLSFDASTTSRVLTGLTPATSYTFTVMAINAYGTSDASPQSTAVVPYTLPGAPAVTAVSAGSLSAVLTWSTPNNGGSVITGFVVTPYIGLVAQTAQSFSGTGTTHSVTGLSAGVSYTFTVAAQNLAGTGPASAKSAAVTPNQSPSLTFTAPPAGEVGVAYSRLLTVTNGTSPFSWSISSGVLPAGLVLNASSGLLSGTPTAAGSFPVTVMVTDASGLTATKAVTLVIAAAPAITFAPTAGEVSVAYLHQPTLTGGTGPFTWSITSGSLPAGLTLNASSGLVSGTPTAAGSFAVTLTVTDSFGQTAARTATVLIVALPAFANTPTPTGQVGVSYPHSFDVTGGALPLTWSLAAGTLPPGLVLDTATGRLSGTPTTTGSSTFTIGVVDANNQTASRTVTIVIAAGPLQILKNANVTSAAAGTVVVYTISVTNTGPASFSGVTLTDPLTGVLDDATYNANAAATSGSVSYTAPVISWTGDLAGSAVVTITYSVTVANPVVGNKVLSNTVSSSTLGTNCVSGSTDARCSATVSVPGLTIVKSADRSTTTPGGTVRVSILVTNTGQTAYPGATLTDGLAGMLDDADYNADAAATSGNLSYTAPSLTWTGSLPVGATVTITYSVTVDDPDIGNRSLTGTVVSPSAGSPCPAGSPAAQCSVAVTVLVPALSITNSADPSSTTPGGVVAYTVALANTGQTPYTAGTVSIALAAALDDGVYGGNATASAGSIEFNAATSTLTWTGNLAVGSAITITYSITVHDPDPGDKTLTTAVSTPLAGSTCPTADASPLCTSTVRVHVPELTIAVSANVTTATPGSIVRYSLSITNTGQTSYPAANLSHALSGVLDDADYNNNAAATTGTVTFTGTALNWSGELLIGASATVTYSATVRQPTTGNRVLSTATSSTSPGNNCPVTGTDPRCTTTTTVVIPGVAISVTADSATTTPGGVVRFTFTAHNTGQTSYNDLDISADVTGALDDADYNNDGAVSAGSLIAHPDGTTTWLVDLAPGETETGTLSVTVKAGASGDRSLVVLTAAEGAGSTCPSASPAPGCRAVVTVLMPGLTITKTADSSTTVPGGVVGYTISVVNTGETAYSPASLRDDLSVVLADAVYSGDATATTGAISFSGTVLSWSGALAPGAAATISYSVTVRDPDPGDKRLLNTVDSSTAGSNCAVTSVDPRCTAVVDVLVPGLTIVKSAGTATTTPGATVGYTITVTNSGATPAAGATFSDTLAGLVDDAAYNGDAAASAGAVSFAGSVLIWTGDLAVGATATVTFSVTVHLVDGGNNLLTDTVTSTSSGANCSPGAADSRCATTVAVARLILSQSYPQPTTTPGSLIQLTATFTNTGQVPYTGITISSPSSGVTDDAIPTGDQTATSGTLTLSSTAISWTGSIPVGGLVTVTGSLTVKDPPTGDLLITGTLSSSAPGNNCLAGSSDSRCVASISVLVPQLTISKVANTAVTVPGGTVAYTIVVHNTGQTPYVGAAVTDSLVGLVDKATYNNDASATSGTLTFNSPGLSWVGDVAPSATVTITFSVAVPGTVTGDKLLVNSVSSTAVGNTCPPASGNAACRSQVVILTPGLTLEKTADLTNATLGTTVTYTVTAKNTGQIPLSAAAFSDDLAEVLDEATYGSASATSGTVTFAAEVLSWSGALAPGASATVTYTVTINNPASGADAMTNTISSSTPGNNCPTGAGDSRCTATVTITNSVTLTFTKTSDVTSTVAAGTVQYTVKVTNSSVLPIVGAQFTDPLAGVLDDATFNNDATASSGTVTYTSPTLTWSGTVGPSSTITITYSVTVISPLAGDGRLTGTVSSTSLLSSNNCVAGSTDPRCTNTVTVAALLIDQHYVETSTTPGSVVHLTATFTNTGQTPYTGISVFSPGADTLDDAIANGDQDASSGTLVLTAAGITWTGNIPVGGTVNIAGTLTVANPDLGNHLMTATTVSAAPGNNCPTGGADPACTPILPVLVPELTITKTAGTTFVVPGGTATYTITVHNSGQTPYVDATVTDSLTGIMDDASYNANATATTGVVAFAGQTLTWAGDLAVGQTVTITYSVTAHSPATGDKTMVNPVSSTATGSTCPPASGNSACRATIAVLTPALTIASAASAARTVPGAAVSYTITATNTGQLPYPAATFDLPLSGVLDDATLTSAASATSGTVAVTGGNLHWTGVLATGAVATITYTVTVDQPVGGDYRLDQTVVSSSPGSNCPDDGADPRCSASVAIASLRIVNAADAATTKPASVVRNTVTISNVGQVPYLGISVNDDFAGSLDDATYAGDAEATSGSLLLVAATGRIIWTGDLAVGTTVTVTGSLKVNNPDAGNKVMTTRVTTDAPATNCPTASPQAACLTSVTVLTPALTLSKTADRATVTPGSSVAYTITAHNTGQTSYSGAQVHDSLAGVLTDSAYANDGTATTGLVTFDGATLTWTGDLAVGAAVIITYSVRVDDPDLGGRTMANQVSSSELGSTCPIGSSASVCTTLVNVLVPLLDIAVVADRTTAVPGMAVAYTVTIRNSGQTDYLAANVSMLLAGVLDDASYPNNATATSGVLAYTSPQLVWSGDLAIGATATVSYSVTVTDPPTGDHSMVTSTSSAVPGSTCGTAAQCTNTVTVLIPGLMVSTTADKVSTTPGTAVTFTTTVQNTGQTPYESVRLDSSLTDLLDDAGFDGEIAASTGVATYSAPDLSWSGALPVGAVATLRYTVIVNNPDVGNKLLRATVMVPAPGSSCPAGGSAPACTATVTVLIPDLTIAISADAPTTTPGGIVTYTIVIANTGQTPYDGATVSNTLSGVLPDSEYNADATASSGTVTFTNPILSWTGDLLIGASTTITYSITVDDPDPGDKLLINTVSSAAPGSNCLPGNTEAPCSVLVRVLIPALSITKAADTATVAAGSVVHYTVSVVNTGQTDYFPATVSDVLTGVLDDAGYASDATASIGTVAYSNSTLVWTGALAAGSAAIITYSVTALFPAAGDRRLENAVTSGSAGSSCVNGAEAGCRSTVTVLVPALTISKAADLSQVVAGDSLHYTIEVTNTGEADYPTATLTDSLAGVEDDASYSNDAAASSGVVTYSAGTLTWTGAIPRDATVLITYSVAVPVTGAGDGVLTNTVVSETVGGNCAPGHADGRCTTSTPIAPLALTLSGLTTSFLLTGLPNSTISSDGTVTMTVTTNSTTGYSVSVQATGTALLPATAGNPATIPIDQLGVRESGDADFVPLSSTDPVIVHQQNAASGPAGDAVSNDYQIKIPFVSSDTYSTTLDYIASSQ